MDITIPITSVTPGQTSTIHTPFGDKTLTTSEVDNDSSIVLHIDEATRAQLASILTSTAPVHYTAQELGTQYTLNELLAAIPFASK